MKFHTIGAFASVFLLIAAVGCSKGPGQDQSYDGDYFGHLSGVPAGDITFTLSGGSITGEGELESNITWRGKGDPPHFEFTGTLTGREVDISIPLLFEFNSAPFGEPPVWVDATTTLILGGRFNDNKALTGSFQGANPINSNNPFTGTWSALKTSAHSGSITRPN
jgi:hypothetical protein